MTCAECKKRLYPDDPILRVGKYHMSACEHYCHKPLYDRELEQAKSEIQPLLKPRPVDRELDQLKAAYLHLQNKVNQIHDKAKNRDRI